MKTQTSVFACVLAMAAVAEALSPRATDAYRQGNGVVEPADTGSSSGSGAVSSGSDGEYSEYWERQDSIYKEAVNKKSDTKCDTDCKNGVDQWVLTQRLDAVDEAAAAAKAKQGCDEPCKKKVDEWARKQKELVTQLDKEMKDRFAAIDAEAAKRKAAPECDDACKKEVDVWALAEKLKVYQDIMEKLVASGVNTIGIPGLSDIMPDMMLDGQESLLSDEEYKKIVDEIAKYDGKYAKELQERIAAIDKEAARRMSDPNCDEKCKELVRVWAKNEKDKLAKEILAKIIKENKESIVDSLKKEGIEKEKANKMIENYLKTIGKAKVKATKQNDGTEDDSAAAATNVGAAVVVASSVLAFVF